MNLVRLLTREESVAGLEISDSFLRIVLLEEVKVKKDKKSKPEVKKAVKCAQEVALPTGVIVGGELRNRNEFIKLLQELVKKCGTKVSYAVVSLPADAVYSKVFGFPKSIQGERLEESMKLTVGFQLPIKTENVYLDWESIPASSNNEIFLAAVPKKVADDFINAIGEAGVKPVAVEFHPNSIARAAETGQKEALLLKVPATSSTLLTILFNGYPYFIRVLPKDLFDGVKTEEEARKLSAFFEAEKNVKIQELDISEAKIIYELYDHPAIKQNNGKWLVAAGAALRGLLPRATDTLVSLMPIGTEEAYAYQKASTFADFLSRIAIVVSVFFVAIFTLLWLFMVSMQQSIIRQVESVSATPIPPELVQLEAKAQKLNGLVGAVGGFAKTFPRWEGVLEEARARIAPGIFITSAGITTPEAPIMLSGVASNRDQLNMFKRFLGGSSVFSEVDIPLTNLGQKENIPFTASLKLKDPAAVYKR